MLNTLLPDVSVYGYVIRRLLFAFLALAFSFSVQAQVGGGFGSNRGETAGTGGGRTIRGHIYVPGGLNPNTRFKVTLESTNSGTRTTTTNADGDFFFNGLAASPYTVTIEGNGEFETARETVSIDREAPSPVYVVPIYLKAKAANVPSLAQEQYKQALTAIRENDTAKAIEYLNAAIVAYPQFSLAFNELGLQYLKSGQPDKAAEALQMAVKLTPNAFTPRLNYGIALVNQKKFPEAEKELRQALKANDTSAPAHLYLGIAVMRQKKLDEAEKELQKAITLNPREAGIAHYYLGGIYWGKNEFKHAADELETYLKLTPNAPDEETIRKTIANLRAKA